MILRVAVVWAECLMNGSKEGAARRSLTFIKHQSRPSPWQLLLFDLRLCEPAQQFPTDSRHTERFTECPPAALAEVTINVCHRGVCLYEVWKKEPQEMFKYHNVREKEVTVDVYERPNILRMEVHWLQHDLKTLSSMDGGEATSVWQLSAD